MKLFRRRPTSRESHSEDLSVDARAHKVEMLIRNVGGSVWKGDCVCKSIILCLREETIVLKEKLRLRGRPCVRGDET